MPTYNEFQQRRYMEKAKKLPSCANNDTPKDKLYSLVYLPTKEVMVSKKSFALCNAKRSELCRMAKRYNMAQFKIKPA